MKRLLLCLMVTGLATNAFCQTSDSTKSLQILAAFGGSNNNFGGIYPLEYQGYITDYIAKYPDSDLKNGLFYGFLTFSNPQDPSQLGIDIQVNAPVKVKYVLYTYKKTFSQDGKRNYYQGLVEPFVVNPIKTQAQIDANLDKIYELPVVTETESGMRYLPWNGYTDPQFTGQKYPVRDCVYVVAYNADTGELIDTQVTGIPIQIYQLDSTPGIEYRIDQQKDNNGQVVKETLSGTVIVAYPDDWPIKKLTALIMTEDCGFGALTYDVINQGADAIAADINRRIPGDVLAHIELTNSTFSPYNKDTIANPTLYLDNYKDIKIFDWKDIKGEDGKDFVPDLVKLQHPNGYELAIIMEMDEMTFTGIKNGFIGGGLPTIPPVPNKSLTGIRRVNVANQDIKIYPDGSGNFVVNCPNGIYATKYRIFDINGKALETGNIVGGKIETAIQLNKGNIYVIQVDTDNSTVTRKVIINK